MKRSADSAFDVESLPGTPGPSYPSPSPTDASECPPRKRSRSEITPEERREARAHRNRIAAQNSRDRRKAQFNCLERRVAELEEENRQLRAGMGAPAPSHVHEQASQERQRELAREKENQELRERIKTLENGWDAVVKALAASGLPFAVPTPLSTTEQPATVSSQPPVVPLAQAYPLSPAPSTPSSSCFEFDEFESTRHLARVATTDAPLLSSVPQQRVDSLQINLSSSSPFPRHRHLPQRQRRSRPTRCHWTRVPWTTSSAKFSRRRLSCHLLHYLSALSKSPPNLQPRPPRRRE
ncbi:hypothetical protein PHLGIDRAFT_19422 [Phlebiopsis gigantea 11061_1 CR5-6]|uniref:X-box-binding protein 1 n=1 Tax=Phlebiopsis gigantea (strain 11061_1 CR5-6) TaxID=745531 RepID=A0A0C3RXE3_PHLG1|nr:hypothetical protein PHLGIDRAFT_19422 [Phlebiopsis gigantea 11061_1 CR5-6]